MKTHFIAGLLNPFLSYQLAIAQVSVATLAKALADEDEAAQLPVNPHAQQEPPCRLS